MTFFVVELLCPQSRTEARLRRRANILLEKLTEKVTEISASPDDEQLQDSLSDTISELSFHLRRIIEISKDTAYAKNRSLGMAKGKSSNIQECLHVGLHLQRFHLLWDGIGDSTPQVGEIVLHSDDRSIGLKPHALIEEFRLLIERPNLPTYTLANESLVISPSKNGSSYGTLNVMIGARKNAERKDGFFWLPPEAMFPGHPERSNLGSFRQLLSIAPNLENDAVIRKAYNAA